MKLISAYNAECIISIIYVVGQSFIRMVHTINDFAINNVFVLLYLILDWSCTDLDQIVQ